MGKNRRAPRAAECYLFFGCLKSYFQAHAARVFKTHLEGSDSF